MSKVKLRLSEPPKYPRITPILISQLRETGLPEASISMASTVVSAPGKVLIAGGYLVLDQKFTGLVISASSRFYVVIQDCQQPGREGQIIVRSPQFVGAEWTYLVNIHDDGTVDVSQASERCVLHPCATAPK